MVEEEPEVISKNFSVENRASFIITHSLIIFNVC